MLKFWKKLPLLRKFSVNFVTLQDSQKISDKWDKKYLKFFKKPTKICLIIGCTTSPLLIDYFFLNRLNGFKEIIDESNFENILFIHENVFKNFLLFSRFDICCE